MKFWWLLVRGILLVEWSRIVVVVQLQIHVVLLENWGFKLLFVLLLVQWNRLNRWNNRLFWIYSCRYIIMTFFRIFPKLLVIFLQLASLWWRIHFRCVVPHLCHLSRPICLASGLYSVLLSACLKLHLHWHGHVLSHGLCECFRLSPISSL